MAQMIIETSSSEKHLDVTDRHIHICYQNSKASFLITDVQPCYDVLQKSKDTVAAKEKELSYAFDYIIYCDGSLDNEVYNTFEACKRYDRESGNAPVLNTIFITGRLSDVKDAPMMEEPKYVAELIDRIKVLGAEHPLAAVLPILETKIAESKKAIEKYDAINKEVSSLKVQEEIAKRKLREQYRLNYLHAQERLGKKAAELLFPVIRKNTKPVDAIIEVEPQPALT
jgi:hypothetical protein